MIFFVIAFAMVAPLVVAVENVGHEYINGYQVPSTSRVEMEKQYNVRHRRMATGGKKPDAIMPTMPLTAQDFDGEAGFHHGVASGDPLPDAVIIWTRYTPMNYMDEVEIEFRMAKVDPDLDFDLHLDPENPNLHSGKVLATGDSDWVIKLDMTGLESGTQYVYAFTDGTRSSPVGLTKTAPGEDEDVESMTYCVFSCSNFPNGYFHAYDICSTIEDLDIWIHTGDYIYEYGDYQDWARDSTERWEQSDPKWEIVEINDYRRRHALYVTDEGLQNLRRRAPLVATWDDHEITNNPYSLADGSNSGAQNHQPICAVNRQTGSPADFDSNYCDRNEEQPGEDDPCPRFARAFQVYLEWLPLRMGPGRLGCVDYGSITQVIEWGKLLSVAAFDTRISGRTKDQTLRSTFGLFGAVTVEQTDVSQYEESPVKEMLTDVHDDIMAMHMDPQYAQFGEENMVVLENFMKRSKDAGKPWQIWAAATMFGDHRMLDLHKLHEHVEDPDVAAAVKTVWDEALAEPSNAFQRTMTAMCKTQTSWNSDGFSGVSVQRAEILQLAKNYANNFVILGGDVHDSWAYSISEDGMGGGDPVAINLISTGVTSPSPWAGALYPLMESVESELGGRNATFDLLEQGMVDCTPGLKYGSIQRRGFYAAKVTKDTHIAEYLLVDPEVILLDFDEARKESGGLTARFVCDASLETYADSPGSLEHRDDCGVLQFDSSRPAVFDLPVPPGFSATSTPLTGCGHETNCVVSN